MTFQFPPSPNIGDQVTGPNSLIYEWDGVKWVIIGSVPYLPLAGGTLTGTLTLAADPVAPLEAATAHYADIPRYGDNRIINGDCSRDQRNNGASGTAQYVYTIDRWQYGGNSATNIWGRNLNAVAGPPGFPFYLGFQSNAAYTLTPNNGFVFYQPIEADMVSDFAWGTVNAQPVTLSFWARSSLIGTFGGSITQYAGTRAYPFSYSIPTANTWTRVTINIPGDTAAGWVMSGNGGALYLYLSMGSGTNRSGPAGAWASTSVYSATGAVSVVAINGATFYFTGVKLEVGSVATPFNRQSSAKSLADCQRYFQKVGGAVPWDLMLEGYMDPNNYLGQTIGLPVSMRAVPTLTAIGTFQLALNDTVWYYAGLQSIAIETGSAINAGQGTWGNPNPATTYLTLSAEL